MLGKSPGLNNSRLLSLMHGAIERCGLDLAGATVLTEAALGPYLVTPVVAALAGAQVLAFTRASRYGTVQEVREQTLALAAAAGVQDRIEIVVDRSAELFRRADIVTNSGHLRPLDAQAIGWMKPSAVLPLRYEAWEYRASDLDLAACRRHGIAVAGTDECHPAIDVFSYLGMMAVKLLFDAGISVYGCRILVLCDNPFSPFIERGLRGAGADVMMATAMADAPKSTHWDAVLVALLPKSRPVLSEVDVARLGVSSPGAVVAQYWGDIDRRVLADANLCFWPLESPPPGHMFAFSVVGPEPIVRLQAGGLKVGEVLWRSRVAGVPAPAAELACAESGWGQTVHGEGF